MGLVRLGNYYARRYGRLVNLDNYYITMYITIGTSFLNKIEELFSKETTDLVVKDFYKFIEYMYTKQHTK